MWMTDLCPEHDEGEAPIALMVIDFVCDQALGIRKGRFVTISDGATWPPKGHEANGGEVINGVAMEAIAENETGSVLVIGVIKMEFGGALTAGDSVKSDNEGRPMKALAADDHQSGGIAYQSGAQGDFGLIFVGYPLHGVGA